ncbi:MAG: hypothetical protein MZV70_76765 [Desulfobacterales bacterium]|nr:hypothetical protein [Desulfobacterales bacterium]
MPEFLAYLGCLFVLFAFLKYLKFSYRRTLWTIFILASLPAAIIESSSTQTNLIMGFLIFSSFYLFLYGTKEKDKKCLAFSAIAFAIALGVKSTSLLFIPVLAIAYSLIAIKERKKDFYKPLIIFFLAITPAFLILSSYNYILNYISYGNMFGTPYFISKHAVEMGFKPFIASFIKYLLLFVNFTGLQIPAFADSLVFGIRDFLFNLFHLKTSDGLVYNDFTSINNHIHENYAMFGLLGFFAYSASGFLEWIGQNI